MRLGVFTFVNDTSIGPVDLAVAFETRGFGSLFVTEHSHMVIASHVGNVTAETLAGYRDLGIEHVTVELPTQPRDETLRRLDALHAEYAKLD
jgi:hypothetical protein